MSFRTASLVNAAVAAAVCISSVPSEAQVNIPDAAERQTIVAWMRTQAVPQTAATPAAFDDLDRQMARAKGDLQKLWPREQKGFVDTLAARQRDVARAIIQSAAGSASQHATRGLEGARAIAAVRSSHDRYLKELDADARAQFNRQLDDSIAVALRSVAGSEKPKLASLPAGLDGALAIVAWRTALDAQLNGLPPTVEITALVAESRQLQQKRLAEGAGEFKQVVAQHPKPGRNGMNAAQLMDRLFADAPSKHLPEYQQYQSVLTAHTQGQARAAAAAATAAAETAAAAAEAAKGPGERCDEVAAHPEDGGHRGAGVADERIVATAAIAQCSAAVSSAPGTARYHFQLGRGYWAGQQYDEAVQAFLKAEDLSYAPSYYYLGQAFEKGVIEGEKADPAAAREMYLIAAAEGFAPAIRAYGGAAAPSVLEDFEGFERPNLLRTIYQNTFDDLEAVWKRDRDEEGPWRLTSYLRGIHDFLVLKPNEFDATCVGVMEQEVSSALSRTIGKLQELPRFGTGLDALLSAGMRAGRLQDLRESGTDDIYALAADYGGCRGPVVRRLYGNLKGYLLKKASAASD